MIEGKVIQPVGSSREIPEGSAASGNLSKRIHKLRGFFRSAPAAMTGNSSKVMENYMKYHKEHCGN